MKLYNSKVAPNPRRVRIFLSEKGVSIPPVEVDLATLQHKTAEFSAINPFQVIPALELDDGTVIGESIAICRYIEELHPEPNLFGATPLERATVEMWQRRVEWHLLLPIAQVFRHTHPHMAKLELLVDHMLQVLRDPLQPVERRDWAAEKAAPYCHAKLAQKDVNVTQTFDVADRIIARWKENLAKLKRRRAVDDRGRKSRCEARVRGLLVKAVEGCMGPLGVPSGRPALLPRRQSRRRFRLHEAASRRGQRPMQGSGGVHCLPRRRLGNAQRERRLASGGIQYPIATRRTPIYLERAGDKGKIGADIIRRRHTLDEGWAALHFGEAKIETRGERYVFEVHVHLGDLDPNSVRLELYADGVGGGDPVRQEMESVRQLVPAPGCFVFRASVSAARPATDYTARAISQSDGIAIPLEDAQILWQR